MDTQLHISILDELYPTVAAVSNSFATPNGGLWTSTYKPETHSSAFVEVIEGRKEYVNPRKERTWWLLTPEPSARIYTLSIQRDLDRFYPCYRLRNGGIHFEALAVNCDALHLTEEGVKTLATSDIVNTWDCESTIWFRWCFVDMKKINP